MTLACDALQAHVAASLDETATRLARITYRNLIPLVCNECMFIGISLGDQVATAALKHVSSVDSATGFHRSVWERLSPSAPTRLSVATVSIWNAQKQLAVTLRAEFAKLPPKL